MTKFISQSGKQTKQIAANLANKIKCGQIIALQGELGSGKTTFTQGFVKALGCKTRATSPTFTIIKQYTVSLEKCATIYHIDCYRIRNLSELSSLGFQKLLNNDNIKIIEWPEKIKTILPKNTILVKFKILGKNKRQITIYENIATN